MIPSGSVSPGSIPPPGKQSIPAARTKAERRITRNWEPRIATATTPRAGILLGRVSFCEAIVHLVFGKKSWSETIELGIRDCN